MIQPNSTLLFIGDSITDASRDPSGEPTPRNPNAGLGIGYVNLINASLTASRPADRIRIINRGVAARTVRDLKNTWEQEVTPLQPQWLSVMIGINDVWRQFDCPMRTDHVHIDEYETTFDTLLAQVRPSLQGLVLMTPYMIEPSRQDPMRALMDQYGAVVRRLAQKHNAIFVDTQAAFDAFTARRHPSEIARDRIHPDTVGHMVLARAWLSATGYL